MIITIKYDKNIYSEQNTLIISIYYYIGVIIIFIVTLTTRESIMFLIHTNLVSREKI
jgi:hypothetical protein